MLRFNIITVVCLNRTCVHIVDQIANVHNYMVGNENNTTLREKKNIIQREEIKNNIQRGKQFNFFVNSLPDYHYYLLA